MGARHDVELHECLQLPTMDVQVRQLTAALRAQRKRLATFVPQLHNNIFHKRLLDEMSHRRASDPKARIVPPRTVLGCSRYREISDKESSNFVQPGDEYDRLNGCCAFGFKGRYLL